MLVFGLVWGVFLRCHWGSAAAGAGLLNVKLYEVVNVGFWSVQSGNHFCCHCLTNISCTRWLASCTLSLRFYLASNDYGAPPESPGLADLMGRHRCIFGRCRRDEATPGDQKVSPHRSMAFWLARTLSISFVAKVFPLVLTCWNSLMPSSRR